MQTRDITSPFRGSAAVVATDSGMDYVETYNPRLGEWARRAAMDAAQRKLRRAMEERAQREANMASPLRAAAVSARDMAADLCLRAHNTAYPPEERVPLELYTTARTLSEQLRGLLPYPSAEY